MALAITRMAPAGYDWKSDCQASRSRNVRVFKRHLEKRVNRCVQKGECDEPVEGKLKHFTKQYEKMHWVAAVTPQDYLDRLTNNFPALVLEARKGLHVPRKAPLARVKMQQPAKLGQVAGMTTRQSAHLAPCCNPGHAPPVTDPRVSEGPCHLLSNLRIHSG